MTRRGLTTATKEEETTDCTDFTDFKKSSGNRNLRVSVPSSEPCERVVISFRNNIGMNEFRKLIGWFTLALLFGWAGLSIFGAFLGAELGKDLFNSWPLAVFWFALALTLAAGFIVFGSLRRCLGLLGMHLGLLLIIAGSLINSGAGHRLAARLFGREKVTWSYLRLREGQTSSALRDRSLHREIGELPFRVRLDTFEIDYYPLPADPPPLYYAILAPEPGTPHFEWKARALNWKTGKFVQAGDTPIRLRVLDFTPARESDPVLATVELSHGDKVHRHELVCPPDEPFVRVALHPIFPEVQGMNRSASLLLARPTPAVRAYRSRVTILEENRERKAEIIVNRPIRVAGYHLYQHSWGDQPERYTVLLVVSDSGLRIVYAGFILLGLGTVWRFWVRPVLRRKVEVPA
jgi:hypothetical protein